MQSEECEHKRQKGLIIIELLVKISSQSAVGITCIMLALRFFLKFKDLSYSVGPSRPKSCEPLQITKCTFSNTCFSSKLRLTINHALYLLPITSIVLACRKHQVSYVKQLCQLPTINVPSCQKKKNSKHQTYNILPAPLIK